MGLEQEQLFYSPLNKVIWIRLLKNRIRIRPLFLTRIRVFSTDPVLTEKPDLNPA